MKLLNKESKLWEFFSADYYRCTGRELTVGRLLRLVLTPNSPTIKYLFFWRSSSLSESWLWKRVAVRLHASFSRKLGFEIPTDVQIGKGLRIVHYGGGIVLNPLVVIGENCELLHGVTIGNNTQKDRRALAKIGNNVSICAGAKIIGGVTIGDNVVIGANAVVTHDIPSNCIAGGGTCYSAQEWHKSRVNQCA